MSYEFRRLAAQLIFDPVDSWAGARGVRGPRPRPLGPLRFDLVGEVVAGQRQDFDVPLTLQTVENPTGYHLFFGRVVAEGQTRRTELADGTYVVRASGPRYQRFEHANVEVPQHHPAPGPYRFDLEPGYGYVFPNGSTRGAGLGPTLLRGCLKARDGSGLADAEVLVVGQSNTYRTDDTGQWILIFADNQPAAVLTVRFRLPQGGGGLQTIDVQTLQPLAPGQVNSFLQAALTGFVTTQSDTPVAGARVRVLGAPGAATTDGNGAWRYYFPVDQGAAHVDVEAQHPDGRTLSQANVPVQAGQTTPVAIFRF